jgi:hypothetical protein
MSAALKAAERGETIAHDPGGKIAAARKTERVKMGLVMDDKVITIEMTWVTIRETSQAGIAEYILNLMREARDTVQ